MAKKRSKKQRIEVTDAIPAVLTDCPYYLVSRTTLLVTAALKRELGAADVERVRPAYLGVLMSLWREDGLIVVELGRRAGLEPSSMTGLLDRMARDGLLRRSPDPADRRVHRIHLTEAGRDAERPGRCERDEKLEAERRRSGDIADDSRDRQIHAVVESQNFADRIVIPEVFRGRGFGEDHGPGMG